MKVYVCSEECENKYVCATESLAKAWLLDQIFEDEDYAKIWKEYFDHEDPDAYDWDSCSAFDAFEICANFTEYWLEIFDIDCTGVELPQPRIEEILPSQQTVADILPEPQCFEMTYEPVKVPRIRHL